MLTSGKRSRLFTVANLPFRETQKHYNVHLLTISKDASGIEMAAGVVDQLNEALLEGFVAWDSSQSREVYVIGGVLSILGDNPAQQDMCSMCSMGSSLHPCRICKVCGRLEDKGNILPDAMVTYLKVA